MLYFKGYSHYSKASLWFIPPIAGKKLTKVQVFPWLSPLNLLSAQTDGNHFIHVVPCTARLCCVILQSLRKKIILLILYYKVILLVLCCKIIL